MWSASRAKKQPPACIPTRAYQGFSLVEMALVLLVMSGVLATVLPLIRSYDTLWRLQTTTAHQAVIMKALEQYFLQNGCLPPPQRAALPPGEAKNPAAFIGIVPFRQLGLPEKVAKDGFQRWMTYAVDKGLTMMVRGLRHSLCTHVFSLPPSLFLKDGIQDIGKNLSYGDAVACLLISHGKTGWGSFSSDGSRYKPTGGRPWSMSKRRNAKDRLKFYLSPILGEEGAFDDQVVWLTRSALVKGAGINCADYFLPAPPQNLMPPRPS